MSLTHLSRLYLSASTAAFSGCRFFIFFFVFAVGCSAEKPGYGVLFGSSEVNLSPSDQSAIFDNFITMFPLSEDGSYFVEANCGDMMPEVQVVDLNEDGTHEAFVQWGNSCTSGMTGRSLTLFTRDGPGSFQQHFGFPALGWSALDSSEQGWPDISFGGPGFCRAVWKWSDEGYQFKCNLPEVQGGCELRGNICP